MPEFLPIRKLSNKEREKVERKLLGLDPKEDKNKNQKSDLCRKYPLGSRLEDQISLLEIEASDSNKKEYFDEGLTSLKNRGYQRHMRPNEAFFIIMGGLEKTKNIYHEMLAGDMLLSLTYSSHQGEWLSLAMVRRDDKLECYLDPELYFENIPLFFGIKKIPVYRFAGVKGVKKPDKTFYIGNIPSKKLIDVEEFPDDLVEFLYSRKFKDFPEVMQKGNIFPYRKAKICMPPNNKLYPVSRGEHYGFKEINNGFDILPCLSSKKPSRGVRIKQ